jgi:CHAT domain-containing protein
VHLACHGQFRPDNPHFSAVRLADGWLTVRDAYSLDLHCELVTLSACESGMSSVTPGDELLGLARGFLSAGAPALLVSLWTADDAATAALMQRFYARLVAGASPATALRVAQCEALRTTPHPYFWAPFILIGRW